MSAKTIADFDSDANRLRAAWDKMFNYASSFGREFRRMRESFPKDLPPDKWGAAWDFDRWMILKVGPSEKTALRMLEILDKGVSSVEKERDRERLAEIRAQQKAEAAKRKAEEHAAHLARANERQQKKAERQSPKQRQEEKKKDREMHAKIKAAEAKIHASRILPPKPQPAHTNGTNGGADLLAAAGHAAERKIAQGNELWVTGVMELAMVLAQVRTRHPETVAFGDWLVRNGFDYDHHDRAALVAMGRLNRQLLRRLLETANHHSFGKIWLDLQKDNRLPPETRSPH